MPDFYITDQNRQQVRQRLQFKGDVKSLSVDFNPWADDNGTVTSVTWSVESGNATIGTEALSSNVASSIITTSESGNSMIKLVATDGTHSEAVYIKVLTKDPQSIYSVTTDYGFIY